ncbi:myristoyl transferase [Gloeocapsopsis sp. IPPAS B-1203]|nr:myristoyl transferase [Gloeocapsopsis sp. IPPAS B-1203]
MSMSSNSHWTRRQALSLFTGFAGSLALHACTQQPSGSLFNTSSTATESVLATSGSTLWIGYTPLYIALEKGFFQENGLNLDFRDFSSATDAMAAFGAGRLDSQALVTSEAVSLAAKGVDYRIIMAADNSLGGDGILARNSITSINDFKGKEVAVEVGGVSHFFLLQVLKEAGLSGDDVRLTNVTPDAAAAAYQAGRTEIAVTYSPFLQKADQAQQDGRIIYDTSQMPTAIVDVYLFSNQFIEANPNAVTGFIQGILQAREFMETDRDEALAIAGKRLQLTPQEVEEQLKGVRLIDLPTNLEMLGNPQSDIYLLNHMNDLSQFLVSQKQIPQAPNLTNTLEPKFLKEVQT